MFLKNFFKIYCWVSLFLFGWTAQAQFMFKTGVHYSTYEETNNESGSTQEESVVFFDPTLLYKFSNGVLLGGNYIFNPVETGGSSEVNTSAYGPTVGLLSGGFFLLATYHIQVEEETVSGSTTTTDTGKGMAFDIGYLFSVNGNFHLGVSMKYVTWNFDKRESSSGSSDIDIDLTRLDPYLTAAFMF